MTINISTAQASALATAGTSNYPLVAWNNLGASGTWSTTTGSEVASAAYAGTGTTYDQWEATPNGAGFARLEVDLGSAKSVSFVGIAAHNAADIGATVRIDTSADGLTYTAGPDTETPTDNQALAFYFVAASHRYWGISFINCTDNPIVGVAFVGNPLTMAQPIYQNYNPPITPTEVALQSNVSEGGHLLGSSAVKKASTASAQITHIPAATIRGAAWKGFQTHFNAGGGFFWAWRPTKYGDLYWSWRAGGALAPDNNGPKDYMSATLNMRLYDEP
jgi:hypothetical protein